MKKTKKTTELNQTKTQNLDQNHVVKPDGSSLSDYIVQAKSEIEDKVNKTTRKLNTKLLENQTINVKYFCDFIPNEKDPEYKKKLDMIPHYAHEGDIGMDIVATSVEYDEEYDRYIYHTGFYAEADQNTGCLIMPRSSNSKTDSYLCNSVGLVDTFTYRGEFCIMFKNRTSVEQRAMELLFFAWNAIPWYKKLFKSFDEWVSENYNDILNTIMETVMDYAPYEVGDRIAQLVWMKFPTVKMSRLKSKEKLSKTERGDGAFGSTGK